ncbi:MAG TPA: hypothetical protein VM266_06035 [Solirubrobacteraceae bacterium]|nr:hypothetical protein [Solirubrobacteraceae bacterium]
MKLRILLVGAAVGALAVPVSAAVAGDGDKVTGGGQVLVGARGAGDTIAFTAQQNADAVKGQVQYVDRNDGTGRGQTTYHGRVSCVDAVGNVAQIAGTWRDGGQFHIYIEDNGEGAGAESDIVTVTPVASNPTCTEDAPDDEDQIALARGNAQVRDGAAGSRSTSKSLSYAKALKFAGLKR